MKGCFFVLDTVEKFEYDGRKVKFHLSGYDGNFTALVQTRKGSAIITGKTIEEVKFKALERVDHMYSTK